MSTLRATNIKGRSNGISPAMPDGVVVTGVTTSTSFSGNLTGTATGLSGTPDVTVRNITGVGMTLSGTLNYEDVTNIDSIGIITARSNVSIADSIIHTGDTDTSIRFPSADTFTVNTAGSERLRISSDGNLGVGTDVPRAKTQIFGSSSGGGKLFIDTDGSFGGSDTATLGFAVYSNATRSNSQAEIECVGAGDYSGSLVFKIQNPGTYPNTLAEKFRIASDGDIRVGSAFSVGQAGVVTCSTVEARVPNIPQNAQASTYTLVKADAGKHINAGGNVTVNSGIFAIGDCISIFNDTTGDITIIQGSSVTLRLVADTSTGTRTLANYGLAAVLCVGSNEFVVSGGGVS